MSTSVLKALPGKLDIKRHSSNILYFEASLAMSTSVIKAYLVNLISKDIHLVFSISRQASLCQQVFSKPCLVNLISKYTHIVFSISRPFYLCSFFHNQSELMYSLICVYSVACIHFVINVVFLVNIKSLPLCVVVLFNVTGKHILFLSEMQFVMQELEKNRISHLALSEL